MEIDVLGIDLARHVFQLHGADRRGRAVHRAKVSRSALFETVRTLGPTLVVMEACSTAHHWARRFQTLGIQVQLISPQYVAPFVKTNKNDRNDAEAIVEAASRPAMRFVTVKSIEQQDIQAAHRMRAILLRQRTALINQMRGLLGERGLAISRSPEAFKRAMPQLLSASADELTSFCQTLLTELLQHLKAIEERIRLIEASIQSFMRQSSLCKKIAAIPGIGPITATQLSWPRLATPGSSVMVGIWRPGWASCPDNIHRAANRFCRASVGVATPNCEPCSSMAHGPCFAT
ncbi:hypothetical protein WJ64_02360 [Burkholderia ubonensis]|nr:hypothetical protein WJ64_02360 [Burkholderia ubonensis]